MQRPTRIAAVALAAVCSVPAQSDASAATPAQRPIRLPLEARISPDGRHVAFSWQEDLWIAPTGVDASDGPAGRARRITTNPAREQDPFWSPDGGTLAFVSDRVGRSQVFTVPVAAGGVPRQITFDSLSKRLVGFHPDGEHVLLVRSTDVSPFRQESGRVFARPLDGNGPERMLFDCGAVDAVVSPDGTSALFTRGRRYSTRKGYRGPQAMQLWLADGIDGEEPTIRRLTPDRDRFQNVPEDQPLWLPDGVHYLMASDPEGIEELYLQSVEAEPVTEPQRVTDTRALPGNENAGDDGVEDPSVSADGRYVLYRHLFDLRILDRETGEDRGLPLHASGDVIAAATQRLEFDRAGDIAFTPDGKQFAFVSGHDLYVMDRILREPVRLTNDIAIESSPVFSAEGDRLLFVSEAGGESDIWEATLGRDDGIWWLAEKGEVRLRKVTDDREVESRLRRSPTGEHIAYVRDTELFVMDADGGDQRRVVGGWDAPDFDWSPDGRWIVYSQQDDDFNDEVWILKLDGTDEPFNLSRHPDSDSGPVWSPDGTRIAWTGRRSGDEVDVWYVTLQKDEEEETGRDRRLEKALKAMRSGKKKAAQADGDKTAKSSPADGKKDSTETGADPSGAQQESVAEVAEADEDVLRIDFDGIHDRIRTIRIPDSYERGLIWSPDGKELWFAAEVSGDRGIYKVGFPDSLRPQKASSTGLSSAEWLASTKEIVGLAGGRPAAAKGSKVETFGFEVRQVRDWPAMRRLAFDQGWRAMRDRFYDPALNDRDWDAVRRKYRDVAGQLLGRREFSLLMNMMLGELNASHMGHYGGSDPLPDADRPAWTPTTYSLGLRLEPPAEGSGLRVASVIPGSPCDLARSKVEAGETVLSIDGREVGPRTDLIARMTMAEERDVELVVRGADGEERTVTVRPEDARRTSGRLYDEWVEDNRRAVEEWSGGRLGYLHIRGMNGSSFLQLEEDLYAAGYGKDGLIIDVRFNGGGSTADRVLTVLTQPRHAFTVPRDGGEGYPQGRKVFASWHEPIVLMCNEHSFSNAEILSHAVNTLDRGPVVGMRTAGGVISTGSQSLMDGSRVRMPFRGWYLKETGQDMELNGAMPDVALWDDPTTSLDEQLREAVDVLAEEVRGFTDHAEPVNASFRRSRKD